MIFSYDFISFPLILIIMTSHECNNRIFTRLYFHSNVINKTPIFLIKCKFEKWISMPRDEFLTIFRRSTEIHRQFPMKGRSIALFHSSNFECCPTFSYFFPPSLPIDKRVTLIFPRCILDSGGEKRVVGKKMTVSLRNAVIWHVNAVSIGDVRNCVVLFLPREE